MALQVLGDALASALFQTLFEKMASPEVLAFFRKKKLDQRQLSTLLLTADKVLDDAEDKQLTDPRVRQWLRDLKDATFDVEDLLAEICDDALQRKMERQSASAARKVIRLVKTLSCCTAFKKDEVLDRLKLVLEQRAVFGFRESVVTSSVSQRTVVTSLVEESGVYGRDAEKRKIVELLLSDDVGGDKISVIPIVGMGGTGKTTLAALVYKNEEVKKHFEVMAWVTVSDNFDVARITKAIIDCVVTSRACDAGDLDRLQVELEEALKEKKFFFVLDDIWEENYGKWDGLRRAFESGAKGSKIIVTTRNGRIASMMASAGVSPHQLHTISNEDCLQLFVKHAFNSGVTLCSDPNLERICKKVVERCKGLPLAVKSLAGLLRCEPKAEWEKILQNSIWELPSEKVEIIPALWLSYHYLPPHLKRCFAYCAIFPQDYIFGKQELILLWMGENLLQLQRGKRPEDIGEEYFNDLLSRSMFQRCPVVSPNLTLGYAFHMHDLVSDLAKYVFGEFCASLEANACNTFTSEFARHLSSGKETLWDVKKYEALSQAKCLRTFLALPIVNDQFWQRSRSMNLPLYDTLQPKLLFNVLSLKVLSLSEYPSTELPGSIGDLKHLRYLDLSSSKLERLPHTLCNLYNLQILLLVCCENLSRLPANTGSLINLRHLDMTGTPLKDMPENLGNLQTLQFLSDFVVGEKSWPNILELEKLHRLHGLLRISRLDDTGEGCRNRRLFPSLGQLVYLKELEIRGFHDVVKIGGDFFDDASSSVSVPFRSLTTLRFEHMSSLNEWSFSRRNGEDGVFPSLTSLNISSCHQLVKLISGAPQHETHTPFPCLESIQIEDCPKLESFLEWGSFSTLVSIDIDNCEKLFQLREQWNLQRFTSLKYLTLWYCNDALDSFPEEGLLPTTLTSLNIYCFRNLTALNGKGLQQLTSLNNLRIQNCEELECFPEEGLPSSLSSMYISVSPLLTERCQREKGEDWSKIAHISHVMINGMDI